MAAILNKKISSAGIFGDFSPWYYVVTQATFLKISAFYIFSPGWHNFLANAPGPGFCLLLGVSSDYAQPITGQVTEVTCPVIGRAQPELTPSTRQKTGPGLLFPKEVHFTAS